MSDNENYKLENFFERIGKDLISNLGEPDYHEKHGTFFSVKWKSNECGYLLERVYENYVNNIEIIDLESFINKLSQFKNPDSYIVHYDEAGNKFCDFKGVKHPGIIFYTELNNVPSIKFNYENSLKNLNFCHNNYFSFEKLITFPVDYIFPETDGCEIKICSNFSKDISDLISNYNIVLGFVKNLEKEKILNNKLGIFIINNYFWKNENFYNKRNIINHFKPNNIIIQYFQNIYNFFSQNFILFGNGCDEDNFCAKSVLFSSCDIFEEKNNGNMIFYTENVDMVNKFHDCWNKINNSERTKNIEEILQ